MNEDGRQPVPVADIDTQLKTTLRQAHRVRWYLVGTVFLLLTATVAVLAVTVARQQADLRSEQAELKASCEFFRVFTPLPATVTPPAKMPSPLVITLIAGSRTAYAGQDCGPLPPAAPSLVRWARYYRIPLP